MLNRTSDINMEKLKKVLVIHKCMNKMLRIAIVVERFPPEIGGSGVRFYKIAECLSKRHLIDIFTLKPYNSNSSTLSSFNVYMFDLSFPLKGLNMERVACLSIMSFLRLLPRAYDVLDVDVWPLFPFFSSKLAKIDTPVIASWNVVWPFSYNREISKVATALAHLISKLSTYNITVSQLAKFILMKYLRMKPERIAVVPNGIDDIFRKANLEPKWGRIVYVGRLEPQKRLDLLLRAFKMAKKQIKDLEFYIFGDGSLYKKILGFSRKIEGLKVKRIGPQERDRLVNILRKSWLFISASEFETYGLAIAEASAVGLPVILTNAPYNAACQEIIRHKHNGLIVPHNNPVSIAKAIKCLYMNPEFWKELSYNAKYSSNLLSWNEVSKRIEKIYVRIAEAQS